MKVLITGASGFVGQSLASSLLSQNHSVILTDLAAPPIPSSRSPSAANAVSLAADLAAEPFPASAALLPADLDAVYVLHGIMSSGAEADLALGYRVNLLSTVRLLDALRARCAPTVRVIYASSCAAYGAPLPALPPSETTLPTPEGSYGTQKLMVELLLNDYTRRGLLTAFSVRLPSITVRAGAPTQAASSWMSGIVREPLQGRESVLPVLDDGFRCWVCSPRTLVRNLEKCLVLPPDCMEPHIRQVLLPGVTVSVGEMLAALREVGGDEAVRLVRREKPTAAAARLFESWPAAFDVSRALGIGFEPAGTFLEAVQDFAAGLEAK
ncbi:nucleoside-diphosphate-sugar epimerase, putative [Cordyceps militaris CM01]|uniref:Nucleoside-diphosphate-sugar epimerase, putative n=1 Tax=Cordyceps militaris (strain CM01) TaxID=983644 RepID=G3JSH1_CORMM|nr:nucleoside-diphosphate-sugar epimerase, putative [Cordyceps militaris CM01]EGX88763.1 nucleoside-diphosphate-sugar epimerase, putative [Cordyceps militaris CM01]